MASPNQRWVIVIGILLLDPNMDIFSHIVAFMLCSWQNFSSTYCCYVSTGHLASAILLDPKYQTFSARTMGDIVTILLSDSNIEHFEPYRCIGVRLGCQLSDHISLVLRWGVNNWHKKYQVGVTVMPKGISPITAPYRPFFPILLHHPGSAYIFWNNRQILTFKVSKGPYWSLLHDRIICKWCQCLLGGQIWN